MADRIPLKLTNLGSGTGQIEEFASGDTVPISQGGTGATTAEAARTNLGIIAPVVSDATTARSASLADNGAYIRFTNASAATFTIPPQSSVTWGVSEIHIRRAAAGNLTLTPGVGVTLNAPSGGTLVMTNNMTATLKRVAADVWDVIGQTVAA